MLYANFSLTMIILFHFILDWVYGYRGKDARSNLFLLPTGELVYFLASVVVLFNPETQKQRHYLGHTEEVKW